MNRLLRKAEKFYRKTGVLPMTWLVALAENGYIIKDLEKEWDKHELEDIR